MKTMSRDLKLYFVLVCLPAAVLTGLGLFFLQRQSAAAARQEVEMRRTVTENLAAALQDSVAEAGKDGDAVRAALAGWTDPRARAPSGAFVWTPRERLVWATDAATNLAARLDAFARWNEWTVLGRKKTCDGHGFMTIDGRSVLWGRVGGAAHGLVFDGPLLASAPSAVDAWLVAGILVVLLVCVLVAGAWLMVRAAAKAREDDRKKTSFVSNASHELKTPLAAIGLWAGLLKSGRLSSPEQLGKAYATITDENARMLRLVENLLDFSRLEQNRRHYRIEKVDTAALVHDAVELMRGEFAPHGVSFAAAGPCPACADADAVKQILVNLLGNAVKYAAKQGPVEVGVARTDEAVRVTVADRGPGMSEEAMSRAFERFYRADDALDSETGGLGLGLSISRALARDLGGELSVAARAGGGCVFTLELMPAEE